MSRKKKTRSSEGITTRPKPSGTAVAAGNGEPSGITVAKPQGVPRPVPPVAPRQIQEDRFWLEVVVIRGARLLGSLQVAVFLLLWFAVVLAIGTIVESWYSSKIAQELVYKTWWFILLLGLLAVNIFFAAAKKWPWKKYQTGFLITHVGLLTLLSGGVVNWFSGTDAEMQLIATDQADLQKQYGLPQTSNRAVLSGDSVIRVRRLAHGGDKAAEYPPLDFEPGSLPWRPDQYTQAKVDTLLAVLNWLDHPLPRSWEANLDNTTRLEVLASYPHTRQEDFSPLETKGKTNREDGKGFPAVQVQLKNPMFGRLPREPWLAMNLRDQTMDMKPILIEMLGRIPPSLQDEFSKPPDPDKLGSKGQLVLALDGKTYRFPVDKDLGNARSIGSGYTLKITKYSPDFKKDDAVVPGFPAVEFDWTTPQSKTTHYMVMARYANGALPIEDDHPMGSDPNALEVWYHPPDYRYGGSYRGVLQFAAGPDDKLWYRSFASRGSFHFEEAGEAKADHGYYSIWKGMDWQFQVREFLPQAVAKVRYVPVDARPGLQNEKYTPAIRCRLSSGDTQGEEFWLSQGNGPTQVMVGKELYEVSYNVKAKPLNFEIKLLRAEQEKDAGTQQAASYTSYVQLTDNGDFSAPWIPGFLRGLTNFFGLTHGGEKIEGEDQVITMNHPLDHRGYKIYQSSYRFLAWDDNEKPVSYSGFTVGRDPGLWLKYLGSSMLALGIACMFYMKAYFFKPRGKVRTVPAAASAV